MGCVVDRLATVEVGEYIIKTLPTACSVALTARPSGLTIITWFEAFGASRGRLQQLGRMARWKDGRYKVKPRNVGKDFFATRGLMR